MNTPPPHFPHGMPPVPRDHDRATLTEILPFGSRKIRMTRSPLTIFLLLCAVATPLLLGFLQSSLQSYGTDERGVIRAFLMTSVTATFIMTITYCMILFFYAKPGRSVWPFLLAYVLLNAIYIVPQLVGIPFIWEAHTFLFRTAWGITYESLMAPNQSFLAMFGKMFVAAGLCEEMFKALPILFGAALALAYQRKPGPRSGFVRFFQIRGPLDGALMGVFTGAAFVFFETGFQYVPNIAEEVREATGDAASGAGYGLMLLFPRVIGGVVGHSAYSAIFGYFIGLAVLRRRQAIPLILAGWLFASLLHGLWNSVETISQNLYYAIAILSAIFAGATILKGRQLNQSMTGDTETMGSIVIDRSGRGGGGGGGGGYGQPAHAGYAPPAPAYGGGYPAPHGGGYPPPQPFPQAHQGGGYPPQPAPYGGYPPAPAAGGYGAAAPAAGFGAAPAPASFPPPPQPQGFASPQGYPPQQGAPGAGYPQPASAPPQSAPQAAPQPAPESAPAPVAKATEPPAPAPQPPAPAAHEPAASPQAPWPQPDRHQQTQDPTETFAAHAAPPAPPAAGEPALVLDIGGLVIPVRPGGTVDLGAEPALGSRGAGARAEIVPHPSRPGVLGLRNSGDRSWVAHLRDGRVQPIERDQNVRLAPGVRIDFGEGIIASVTERS